MCLQWFAMRYVMLTVVKDMISAKSEDQIYLQRRIHLYPTSRLGLYQKDPTLVQVHLHEALSLTEPKIK